MATDNVNDGIDCVVSISRHSGNMSTSAQQVAVPLHVILSRRRSSESKSSSCQLVLVFSESPVLFSSLVSSKTLCGSRRCVTDLFVSEVDRCRSSFGRSSSARASRHHLSSDLLPRAGLSDLTPATLILSLAAVGHAQPSRHLTGSGVIVSSHLRNAGNELATKCRMRWKDGSARAHVATMANNCYRC